MEQDGAGIDGPLVQVCFHPCALCLSAGEPPRCWSGTPSLGSHSPDDGAPAQLQVPVESLKRTIKDHKIVMDEVESVTKKVDELAKDSSLPAEQRAEALGKLQHRLQKLKRKASMTSLDFRPWLSPAAHEHGRERNLFSPDAHGSWRSWTSPSRTI